jgi:hypothetical protein
VGEGVAAEAGEEVAEVVAGEVAGEVAEKVTASERRAAPRVPRDLSSLDFRL